MLNQKRRRRAFPPWGISTMGLNQIAGPSMIDDHSGHVSNQYEATSHGGDCAGSELPCIVGMSVERETDRQIGA